MKTYKGKWYQFTPDWSGFSFSYDFAGYFDTRPVLQIYFIWGKLFIFLPWKHYKLIEQPLDIKETRKIKLNKIDNNKLQKKVYKKIQYEECEPPRYGIGYYDNHIIINYGLKCKVISLSISHTKNLGS